MSIGQKRVIHHLSDVISDRLSSLTAEVNQLRQEIRTDELDQVDHDTIVLYDNLISMLVEIKSSVQQIKIAKYNFEKDPIYGKVIFLDFRLRKSKHEV